MITGNGFCIVIVDALELRRAGIAALIEPWASSLKASVLAIAPDMLTVRLLDQPDPIFVIFSIGSMSLNAQQVVDWAADIRRELPQVPCLVLSDRAEPEEAVMAARLGEQAFMSTSVDPEIALQAFAFVVRGGTYFPRDALQQVWGQQNPSNPYSFDGDALTPRQMQVLQRLLLGSSNKLIARELSMQESTVKVHVREIMRKLGAHNRTEAAMLAGRKGLIRWVNTGPSADRLTPITVPPHVFDRTGPASRPGR